MIVIENPKIRKMLRWLIPFLLIPLVVALGALLGGAKKHLLISFLVAALSMLLFLAGFERKKAGARRMVLSAVMIALCIVGRFIPFFKPVTALTILAAMYLGGEAGFLVGSFSAVLSNFYFGQGPWTPFQMLAWGMIGLIAGLLAEKLKGSRALLLIFGVLSGLIYSLLMDVWTVLWYDDGFRWDLYGAAMLTALPHTIVYSLSNLAFLFFLGKPMGEKLERIRIKYGL